MLWSALRLVKKRSIPLSGSLLPFILIPRIQVGTELPGDVLAHKDPVQSSIWHPQNRSHLTLTFPKKGDLHVPLAIEPELLMYNASLSRSQQQAEHQSSSPESIIIDGQTVLQPSPAGQRELSRSLMSAKVWEWTGGVLDEGQEAAEWLSDVLGTPAR
jgi:hypothetical protein